jgi:hypothetical protein
MPANGYTKGAGEALNALFLLGHDDPKYMDHVRRSAMRVVSNDDKPKCLESADTIIFVAYKGNANFMSVMPNLKEACVVDPESCIYTTQNVCTVDRFYISNIPSNGKYPLFPNIQTVEYNKDINDIGPLRQAFPNAVIRMEPNKEINITKDGRVVRYSRRR